MTGGEAPAVSRRRMLLGWRDRLHRVAGEVAAEQAAPLRAIGLPSERVLALREAQVALCQECRRPFGAVVEERRCPSCRSRGSLVSSLKDALQVRGSPRAD